MDLTLNDYINIMQLLRRANYVGLDEAAMGVELAQKISAKAQSLQDAAQKAPDIKDSK